MIVDITIDGKDFQVDYNYTPAARGYRDRYGLQMEPDTDAELEILAIRDDKLRQLTNFIRDCRTDLYIGIEAEVLSVIEEGDAE